MNQSNPTNTTATHVNFGVEVALLIILPLAVLIAGAVTASLAYHGGFTPIPEPQGVVVHLH